MSQETSNGPFDLSTSPSHLLHRAQQLAVTQSAGALREAGLTLRQFAVLVAITSNEGVSQSQLVEETGIDRSTLAEMVRRMELAGLVKRSDSALDGRAKSVMSTAKGRRAMEKTRAAVEEADDRLMESLPKNRRAAFLSVLALLAEVDERGSVVEEEDKTPSAKVTPVPAKSAKKAGRDKAKAEKSAKRPKSGKKAKAAGKKKKKKTAEA